MEERHHYLISPLAYTGAASAFTYHYHEEIVPGGLVQIPIGKRVVMGIVDSAVAKPTFVTKALIRPLDVAPVPYELIELAHWVADFYVTTLPSVWNTMLPAGLAKTRREPVATKSRTAHGLPDHTLTNEQTQALASIEQSPLSTHLVQGVTGSGKTRLYLELAARTLASGKSVIILVPEITLTPQMVTQFEHCFGEAVLASHSKLTEAKRHHIWQSALDATAAGQARIIIGPRSCLFMPVHALGLIVIDECHETTYKQERSPRYNALTTAAWRARNTNATLILGSATPGLSERYLAQQGRINHVVLNFRTNKIALPEAKIIDIRDKSLFKLSKFIAQDIVNAVEQTKAEGRQSLLYLNRRGSASSQVCGNCGYVSMCPNCTLPLTFHADLLRLLCHHCNYRVISAAVCPECNAAELRLLGGGTKRIEAEVERLFPEARIARLDRDSATLTHIHAVLRQLKAGELDILIGTQMIAKGLDLPAIDTIGVIGADTMLHLPDFTAAERTYQLLSQVSGRAGRGDRAGRIFIQTYTPEHPAITAAATGAYDAFADAELSQRKLLNYPPYTYLLKLTIATTTREAAIEKSEALARDLRSVKGLHIIGPAPAFIETQGGKFHWIITVKSPRRPTLVEITKQIDAAAWTADLDPVNLL